jgi:Zn-dependent protease with chaperone function
VIEAALIPFVIPFLTTGLLALTGPWLGRALPPEVAARWLTAACLVTSLATGIVLGVGAITVLAQFPASSALAHWSGAIDRTGVPLPAVLGLPPAALVLVLFAAAVLRAVMVGQALACAELTCRRLGPAPAGLVVVDDEHPDAYTLAGITGRIVVSTAMLRALPVDERRALLAHEHSHLRHRHHLYSQLAGVAAVANPLLRAPAAAVRLAVERWADEDAADETDDRALVARTLARAGLARAGVDPAAAQAAPGLGAADSHVAERALAMLGPAPRPRPLLRAALVALVMTTALAGLGAPLAEHHVHRVMAQAQDY